MSNSTAVSVVIPVHNDAEKLERLFAGLTAVLDWIGRPYEILFTNDGSSDRSLALLREFQRRFPREVRVIDFDGTFGVYMAIMAAFERVRGDVVVILDADLRNPDEELPRLLAAIDAGRDVVDSDRREGKEYAIRRWASRLLNLRDRGRPPRAYRRAVVQAIVAGNAGSTAGFPAGRRTRYVIREVIDTTELYGRQSPCP